MNIKKKERDYYFDNLRFIFIFFVVLAHMISPLGKIMTIKTIYRFVYLFHMPGMIFVSGYFAKSSIKDGKIIKNKFFNFVLLYSVFQILFTLLVHGRFSIFQSQFGLWYLQLLMVYSLLLPMLSRVKPLPMIIISIALGLLVGFDTSAGHVGSLQRLLVFLPFYMIGYYCDKKQIEKIFKKRYVVIGLIILATFFFLQFKYMNVFPWSLNLSSGKISYRALGVTNFTGLIARTVWYFISSILIISTMALTPRSKTIISCFGSRTLSVFLLHLPTVVLLRRTILFTWLNQIGHIPAIVIIICFSLLVTILYSLRIFSYPFDFLMNIKFKYLLKDDESRI